MKTKQQEKILEWKQNIAERKNSHLTIAQWCDKKGIKISTYKYWFAKIRTTEASTASSEPVFAKLELSTHEDEKVSESEIKIQYSDFKVLIGNKDDLPLLAEVLKTLQSIC